MIEFNVEIDAVGLHCPLPLLRLKKALKDMQSGEVVRVMVTDPAAHLDFGVYAEQTGHDIIEYIRDEQQQVFYVRKK